MAVPIQTVRVVPPVVMALELYEFCSSRVRPSQAQSQHRGFAATIGEAHRFGSGHHATKTLSGFRLRRGCGREMRTFGNRPRDYIDNLRMRMPMNERAERHHEIDVFVPVEVPHV